MNEDQLNLISSSKFHAFCLIGDREKCFDFYIKICNKKNIDKFERYTLDAEKISIKEVRALEKWFRQRPINNNYKSAYIDLENVRSDSLNTLLKTLEEPPPYALIALRAQSTGSLLPTIKSRCQVVFVGFGEEGPNTQEIDINSFADIPAKLDKAQTFAILSKKLLNLRNKIRLGQGLDISEDLFYLLEASTTTANNRILLEFAQLLEERELS